MFRDRAPIPMSSRALRVGFFAIAGIFVIFLAAISIYILIESNKGASDCRDAISTWKLGPWIPGDSIDRQLTAAIYTSIGTTQLYTYPERLRPFTIGRLMLEPIVRGEPSEETSFVWQAARQCLSNHQTPMRASDWMFRSLGAAIHMSHLPASFISEVIANRSFFGDDANGKEVRGYAAAAEFFYRKELSVLDATEKASLAAISISPDYLNPRKNPDRFLKKRNFILHRMSELGAISDESAAQATKRPAF